MGSPIGSDSASNQNSFQNPLNDGSGSSNGPAFFGQSLPNDLDGDGILDRVDADQDGDGLPWSIDPDDRHHNGRVFVDGRRLTTGVAMLFLAD